MTILVIYLRATRTATATIALVLLTASVSPAQTGAGQKIFSYLNSTLRTDSLLLTVTSQSRNSEVSLEFTGHGATYDFHGLSPEHISVRTHKEQLWQSAVDAELFRELVFRFAGTEALENQPVPSRDSLLCEVKLICRGETYRAQFGRPLQNSDVAFMTALSQYVYTLKETEPTFPEMFPAVMEWEEKPHTRGK